MGARIAEALCRQPSPGGERPRVRLKFGANLPHMGLMSTELEKWGWNTDWAGKARGSLLSPARVMRQERDQFVLVGEEGVLNGIISGTFLASNDRPVTGDWVLFAPIEGDEKVMIEVLLPRSSELARQGAGEKTQKQVIAANVDLVLMVMGLDNDFNLRRLERYLRVVSGRGVEAVVVLNKSDVADDLESAVAAVEGVAAGVAVIPLSALTGEGMAALDAEIRPGRTLVVVGSSGVGKSTLVNHLLGDEVLPTFEVREGDDRGRHTTTQRELLLLPSGALIIDTPGIRELSEWQEADETDAEDQAFGDIEALALTCKFRDCSHSNEPGCAVRAALEDGRLDEGRYRSYLKLEAERAAQVKRQEEAERRKARPVRGRSRRIQNPKKR